jgi:hypothetical protein
VLGRKFRPKREELTGGYRELYNEEVHNLHASSDIIRMNNSRKMRSAGYVA